MSEFIQAGPTCGFYCIEYAMSMAEGRDPDEENVKKMLLAALEEGRTVVGEIFTAEAFLSAFQSLYAGRGEARMGRLGGRNKLKQALLEGPVVLPVYSKRKRPHFYVLTGRDGESASIYDPGDRANGKSTLEALLWMNQQLKDAFDWDAYFEAERGMGLYRLLKDHVRSPRVMGAAAQAARRHGRREHAAGRVPSPGRVDLRGSFFVIRSTKGDGHERVG